MNNKKVQVLRAHSSLFASGWGNLTNTISPATRSDKTLKMIAEQEGVYVSAAGRVSFLVPWTNIQSVEFAPEETSSNS